MMISFIQQASCVSPVLTALPFSTSWVVCLTPRSRRSRRRRRRWALPDPEQMDGGSVLGCWKNSETFEKNPSQDRRARLKTADGFFLGFFTPKTCLDSDSPFRPQIFSLFRLKLPLFWRFKGGKTGSWGSGDGDAAFIDSNGFPGFFPSVESLYIKEKVTGRRLGLQMFATCVDFFGMVIFLQDVNSAVRIPFWQILPCLFAHLPTNARKPRFVDWLAAGGLSRTWLNALLCSFACFAMNFPTNGPFWRWPHRWPQTIGYVVRWWKQQVLEEAATFEDLVEVRSLVRSIHQFIVLVRLEVETEAF